MKCGARPGEVRASGRADKIKEKSRPVRNAWSLWITTTFRKASVKIAVEKALTESKHHDNLKSFHENRSVEIVRRVAHLCGTRRVDKWRNMMENEEKIVTEESSPVESSETPTEAVTETTDAVTEENAADEAEAAAESEESDTEAPADESEVDIMSLDDGPTAVLKKSKSTIIGLVVILLCIIIAAGLIILGIIMKKKSAEPEKSGEVSRTDAAAAVIPISKSTEKYDIVANVEVEGIKVGLARYKDIVITAKKGVVTEDQFNEAIDSLAATFVAYNEITDRACREGDIVSIDYAGSIDGVAFDGGTGSTDELALGSGAMIPGFEEGIIGHKTGEEFDIDVTFPENYGKEELNGKPAVFHITLKKISESCVPELTDEVVAENTEYTTVEDFKNFVRDYLQNAADANEQNIAKGQFWENLIASSTFEGNLDELNARYEEELTNYTMQTQGDTPLNIMMNYYGYDEETAKAYVQDQILKTTKQELILKAVIANEGLTLDEEEYNSYIEGYMAYVQATSKEEFFDMIGGDEDFFKEDFMQNKAYDFIDAGVTVNVE